MKTTTLALLTVPAPVEAHKASTADPADENPREPEDE